MVPETLFLYAISRSWQSVLKIILSFNVHLDIHFQQHLAQSTQNFIKKMLEMLKFKLAMVHAINGEIHGVVRKADEH